MEVRREPIKLEKPAFSVPWLGVHGQSGCYHCERASGVRGSEMRAMLALSGVAVLLIALPVAAQSPQFIVAHVLSHPSVKSAQQFIETDHDRIVREIIAIAEIEAPPFKEM